MTARYNRRLKVFGGFIRGRRAIMGAYSWNTVATAIGESYEVTRKFWAETENSNEVALASSHPGTLFIAIDRSEPSFKEVAL